MSVRVATISRMGNPTSAPNDFHITTAASTQLKYGPGTAHSITIGTYAAQNSVINIYDAIGAATGLKLTITATNQAIPTAIPLGKSGEGIQFFTGLYIVTTGTWSANLSYE